MRQKQCQIEYKNIYAIYIYIHTSRLYVRNYVRICVKVGFTRSKVVSHCTLWQLAQWQWEIYYK